MLELRVLFVVVWREKKKRPEMVTQGFCTPIRIYLYLNLPLGSYITEVLSRMLLCHLAVGFKSQGKLLLSWYQLSFVLLTLIFPLSQEDGHYELIFGWIYTMLWYKKVNSRVHLSWRVFSTSSLFHHLCRALPALVTCRAQHCAAGARRSLAAPWRIKCHLQ